MAVRQGGGIAGKRELVVGKGRIGGPIIGIEGAKQEFGASFDCLVNGGSNAKSRFEYPLLLCLRRLLLCKNRLF
jgi:hypothetical protein